MVILSRPSKRWKSSRAHSNAHSINSFTKVKSLQNCRTYSSGSRPMTSLGAALARTLVISVNFAACWGRRKKAIASLFSTWPRKWPIASFAVNLWLKQSFDGTIQEAHIRPTESHQQTMLFRWIIGQEFTERVLDGLLQSNALRVQRMP